MNSVGIIFEFSNLGRVETNRNEKKKFSIFQAVPTCFSWNVAWMMFIHFLNFFWYYFLILLLGSGRTGLEQKLFFFSLFFSLSRPVSAWNEARMKFLNFFDIFLEFSNSGRTETSRNENLFFSIFQPVSARFGLKWSQDDVF